LVPTARDHGPPRRPHRTSRLDRISHGLIGEGESLDSPYGPHRITYADYTASGRALDFVEDFVRRHVLPRYANTHTESSGTGCSPSTPSDPTPTTTKAPAAATGSNRAGPG